MPLLSNIDNKARSSDQCKMGIFCVKDIFADVNFEALYFLKACSIDEMSPVEFTTYAQWFPLRGSPFEYRIVANSNARYLLGNQLFVKRSQYIRIKKSPS